MRLFTDALFLVALGLAAPGCWIEDFGKLFNPDRCAYEGAECGNGRECCEGEGYCDFYGNPPTCRKETPYPYSEPSCYAGDRCETWTGGVGICLDAGGGETQCFEFCSTLGDACADGGCYFDGMSGDSVCMPGGYRAVGEACKSSNDCIVGMQCLDGGEGMYCWMVCDDWAPCDEYATCTDTGLGFSVCVDDVGGGGKTCAGMRESCKYLGCCTGLLCSSARGECVECLSSGDECADDSECCPPSGSLAGAWCGAAGTCQTCSARGGGCASDYDCCPATGSEWPLMCNSGGVCAPMCWENSHCKAGACAGRDEICLPGGECACPPCVSDGECGGMMCCSGVCQPDCGHVEVDGCAVTTKGRAVESDGRLNLHAIAWRGDPKTGAQIAARAEFAWRSSDPAVVAVDSGSGEALGGDMAGVAEISASAGAVDCGKVAIANYLPAASGSVRVVAYDAERGTPVAGASVLVGAEIAGATDAMGLFEAPGGPGDVHVFHKDYAYVSILGLQSSNVVVRLVPNADRSRAGGFKGEFDFAGAKDHAFETGLAGGSVTDFTRAGPEALLGDMILTPIRMKTSDGAPVDVDLWTPFPGALTVKATEFGAPDLVPRSFVTGEKGLRAAWGIGGGLPGGDSVRMLQILSWFWGVGGGEPFGLLLPALLPLVGKMRSAAPLLLEIEPIDTIATPCVDVGSGGIDFGEAYPCRVPGRDLVPLVGSEKMADYDRFPEIQFQPTAPMMLKTVFSLPELPKLKGRYISGAAVAGGAQLPELGFVPLGFTAGLDRPDDPTAEGDGRIDPPADNPESLAAGQVALPLSPGHSGLEGRGYVFAVLALDLNTLGKKVVRALSGRLKSVDSPAPADDLSGARFLEFGEGVVFERAGRTISERGASVTGAEVYRYVLTAGSGEWHVYAADVGAPITLPPVPAGLPDRTSDAGMSVHAFGLAPGRVYADVFSASAVSPLGDPAGLAELFSVLDCLVKIKGTDADYVEKCTPVDPTKIDPACNPACEVR